MEFINTNDNSFNAILQNDQSTFFRIIEILKGNKPNDEKFENLKILLKPSLIENPNEVLSLIISINLDYNFRSPILENLISWINENYI